MESKRMKASAFISAFRETFSSFSDLVDRVLRGSMGEGNNPFRSLVWSVLLDVLDVGGESFDGDWEGSLGSSRGRYEALLKKHEFDVRRRTKTSGDLELDNPLSTHSSSAWNQYFINSELREEILRDVVRTYPGNSLFRSQTMQSTLTDILFIYAKEFPSISYKQGMHEILAAVLLVIREGVEQYVGVKAEGSLESLDPQLAVTLRVIYDPLYTEHDAFALFESIMRRMVDWYWSPPPPMGVHGHPPTRRKQVPISSEDKLFEERRLSWDKQEEGSAFNPSKRLDRMWNDILAMYDVELFDHLEDLGIIPTTFGINWLKLLYSRQFFDDFAFWELWDVIFATNFILQDYVLVAMLVAIRDQLLASDNTGCNTLLVSSYPKTVHVNYILKYSLHLFDGAIYPRPEPERQKISLPRRRNSISKETSLRRPQKGSSHPGREAPKKSVELVEYLGETRGDGVKGPLEHHLRARISSWKNGLDFNVDFLRTIFRGEDIRELDKFERALSNLKAISGEMRGILRSSSSGSSNNVIRASKTSSSSKMHSSSFLCEEALNLIDNNSNSSSN